ncbi:hypothetical protein QE152_g25745 [Popillia japonica]|uniref:Uncharacterized protein n=1 Tax=Popillia japonica TaxID=7064 RepID=A0AAW1K0L2_POPJA
MRCKSARFLIQSCWKHSAVWIGVASTVVELCCSARSVNIVGILLFKYFSCIGRRRIKQGLKIIRESSSGLDTGNETIAL